MSSYVIIDFDRTAPEISIYAPRYTARDAFTEIIIEANEPLALYQDIYAIDNNGTRYNLTFDRETDTLYEGVVQFNAMPLGIITIYARLKDEVDNFSNVVSTSIEIKDSLDDVFLEVKDHTLAVIDMSNESQKVILASQNRKVELATKSRKVKLSDEVKK